MAEWGGGNTYHECIRRLRWQCYRSGDTLEEWDRHVLITEVQYIEESLCQHMNTCDVCMPGVYLCIIGTKFHKNIKRAIKRRDAHEKAELAFKTPRKRVRPESEV